MKYENILLETRDRIARVTLNRPQALNALNGPLLTEVASSLQGIEEGDTADVLILTGAGKAFCAGMDLHALSTPDKKEVANLFLLVGRVIEQLRNLKLPVIVAVNGPAVTGGLELALACDIVLAGEGSVFGDTHARVGIMPGGGDSQILPRLVGMVKAKEMLFASRLVSAQEAERTGLAARVVAADKLQSEAWSLAESIRDNDPSVVRRLKRLVNEGMRLDLNGGLMLEQHEFQNYLRAGLPPDFIERVRAVLQRKTG
ncbi:MAG: enoyl-CoA hydratase/isomerase family protein [Chloroflexi bacterium]|nr:enoyl-CoA hydratase/isomerase family protein [Chloroflexota bacterium]